MKWYADKTDIESAAFARGKEQVHKKIISNVLSHQKSIAKTADILGLSCEEVATVAKAQDIPADDLPQ